MITYDQAPQLVRGENPEPESGWPWCLTDYEVAYVRQFNVRPPRAGSWVSMPDAEHRLEQEADGIREHRTASKGPWAGRRVRRSWPWITIASLLVAGALALGVFGYVELQQAQTTNVGRAQKTSPGDEPQTQQKGPAIRESNGGSDGRRSRDLTIFSDFEGDLTLYLCARQASDQDFFWLVSVARSSSSSN